MIAHAFIKITLFYCAGAILHKTEKEYVRDMTGIAQSMPFTIVCFLVSGMGLIGIPPFIGFLSKWNLCTAAVKEGSIGAIIGCIVLLVSALLTAVYIFRFVITAYHSPKAEEENSKEKTEPSLRMMIPMGLFSVMVLALAIYAKPLLAFFENVASGLI